MPEIIAGLCAFIIGVKIGSKYKEIELHSLLHDIQQNRLQLYNECNKAKEINNKAVTNLSEMYKACDVLNGIDNSDKFTDRDEWLMSLWMD